MPARFPLRTLSSLTSFLLLISALALAQNISSLTPNSGPIGTSVTIAGSGFGTSQGSSTVAFNGTNATPTGWNDGQIVAPVPNGATSGNVVVTVNGTASNGVFFTVTTVAPSLVSISVTPGSASVAAGNSQPFGAAGTYSDSSTQDVSSTAIWTSSDPTVAVVDASGNATAIDNGAVTIQASLGSVSGSASLTVTPGQLNAIITTAYTPSSSAELFSNQKAIAVGTDGFSRFVTGDSSGNAQRDEVVYVHCLDQDCKTSNTATFQTGAYTYEYAMAVGPDGFARVVYSSFGSAPDGFNAALGFIQCSDTDCADYTQTIVDGTSDNAVASVAVDSNGNANIIYDDGNDSCRVPGDTTREDSQGIGLAICSGTSCTTRQITTIDCHSGVMGAITVDSNNNPQMLYNDSGSQNQGTSDSVHYYAGADRVISTDGLSCCAIDLALGPDGFSRAAFLGNANGGIDFVQCADASCESSTLNNVAFQSGSPGGLSLQTGSDGKSVLEVALTSSIEYIQCPKPDCSVYSDQTFPGNWSYSNLVSLALDSAGLPRMIAQTNSGSVAHARPRAVPVKFHMVNAIDQDADHGGPPFLKVNFAWESSTGNADDLKGCFIREYVVFPTIDNAPCPSNTSLMCFYPPSPPWPAHTQGGSGAPNPTVNPPPGYDASLLQQADEDFLDNIAFVQPYVSGSSWTGTQIFQYQCDSGPWVKLYGPQSINYSMFQDQSGTWSVTVSRSDTNVTSYYVIP